MQHEQIEQMMIDYISGHMSPEAAADFHRLLADRPDYSQELVELKQIMDLVEHSDEVRIPEPSAAMDQAFYQMLDKASQADHSTPKTTWFQRLINALSLPPVRRFASGTALLFLGVFIGHYVQLVNQQDQLIDQRMAAQDQQIQALTVLSLLDMPSAQKRLMAVSLVGNTQTPDATVVAALIQTLNHDENVNVRLETLDVLAQFAQDNTVRQGLVNAISHQDSPMVQVAMANLMLKLNEKQAVEPLQSLINQPSLLEPVKAELNKAVNELI